MKSRFLLYLFLLIIFSIRSNTAQNMDSRIEQLSSTAGSAYLAPVVHSFGAGMNAGWMGAPPSAKVLGFDLQIGLVGMETKFADNTKTFSVNGTYRFNEDQAMALAQQATSNTAAQQEIAAKIMQQDINVVIYGPTIRGSKNDNVKIGSEAFNVSTTYGTKTVPAYVTELSGIHGLFGDDVTMMPAAAPQIKIGTVYGTQAIIRFFPSYDIKDAGKFKFFGFGLQHNPGLWFKTPLPVDVSVGFLTQSMKLGSIVDFSTISYGINVGKQFGFGPLSVTPYGGLLLEKSKLDVTYTDTLQTSSGKQISNVNFSLTGDNTFKFNLGVKLHIFAMDLLAEYNIGKYSTLSGTFAFAF
jgi:hypothetical protein